MTWYLWMRSAVGLYLMLQLGSGHALTPLGRQSKAKQQQILYTFEYDSFHPGSQQWERVPYDDASIGLVRWMMGLKDRLTVSRKLPLGQDLTVYL